ncbi:outer membrane beta-barrel protein [Mongoliitalea daihaiensis]|uniref:outer membrane beta-barrel protein n=1 Tax=Mongoliitalea daihaiensis TaxID=2782006 RepID=UPI001F3E782D|nr:outer membrane beta-barrel protein [Mongoliitalea daihaiensis]UJP63783.1 outer membrane beta-barrel protein [Mongoliitalea daihaiensis]
MDLSMVRVFAVLFFLLAIQAQAQEVKFGLGVGQALIKGEQSKERVAGIRYHALYEYQPYRSPIAFGFTASLMESDAAYTRPNGEFNERMRIIPVAFAPKLMFSEYDSKAFVKAMIGAQQTRSTVTADNFNRQRQEYGFYGGVGAGVELGITSFLFAILEYELSVVGSRLVNNPVIHSAQVAIGIKFN